MVETKTVVIGVALILIAGIETAFCAEQFGARKATSNVHLQEWNAYYHPASDEKNLKDAKSKYLLKLSPGGRIYFLANRKDFAEALSELKRFDRQDTGSALYVKAMCLDGLKKHAEAVQSYAAAQSKIDLVFHPGPKFYLQYATALMHAQDYSAALKNLDTAEKMSKNGTDKGRINQYENSGTVRKRKAAIYEMQGRYKEAFAEYVILCGKNASHFRLNSPLRADPLRVQHYDKWLKDNPSAPTHSTFEQAKYFCAKGKAYLMLGNVERSREALTKALSLLQDEKIDNTLDSKLLQSVSETRYQALCMLVRVDYEKGKFKDCCKSMGAIVGKGLTNEFDSYFTTISMSDVPQLVMQKDVDLHSIDLEQQLDFVDYLHDPVAQKKNTKNLAVEVPPIDETLLLQARREMTAREYIDCYETLDRFIDANVAEGFAPAQLYLRGNRFINNYLHKVRMLQLGAGFASSRQNMALSLRGNLNPGQSDFWNGVEDRLLGRQKLNSPKDAAQVKNNPRFVPWCHYAIGLRALSKKNYKAAAAEFGAVKLSNSFDSDLPVYSRVLKAFCEGKR